MVHELEQITHPQAFGQLVDNTPHLSTVRCLHLLQLPGTFVSIPGHFPSLTCASYSFVPRLSCCTIYCAGLSRVETGPLASQSAGV